MIMITPNIMIQMMSIMIKETIMMMHMVMILMTCTTTNKFADM